LILCI